MTPDADLRHQLVTVTRFAADLQIERAAMKHRIEALERTVVKLAAQIRPRCGRKRRRHDAQAA